MIFILSKENKASTKCLQGNTVPYKHLITK